MSDLDKINDALARIFNEGEARIVFWNDPDQEFQSVLPLAGQSRMVKPSCVK
jgi:hypothetical protein